MTLSQLRDAVRQARSRPWHEIPWRTQRVVVRMVRQWMERRSVVRQEAAVSADEMRRSLAAPLAAAVDGVGTVPFGRLSFRGEARRSLAVDFKANHPEVYNAILHDAEDAMAHRFDLLGSGPTQLGPTIDWSRDFKSGFRWPRGYVKEMVLVDPSFHADLKVPWDLSRGHQMVRLGQAYWLTNDERFAEELMKQWVSWVDENPYIQTCNWGNAMETAIRAANWLAAFTLTRDSEAQTSAIRQRFLCATLEHGRFIAGNLEKFEGNPTSNHYLSDLVGLVYLGVLTPWFKESKVWLEMGLRGLEVETLTQVGADGFDYEGSINYHRLVGELLLSAFALARANGHAISDAAWSRALAMPETTLQYTRPDGRAPLIGDVDNGRLHWFTPETPDDHRSLLGLASALTGRPDYAHAAGRALAEGFWWNEVPKPDASADLRSRYFENSGLAVLRNRHAHVVVHCGEPRGPRGHFHNDLLSVEVSLRGAAWIIDPGTFEYTKSESDRNHFRRTRAHNTVQIGDEEMNEIVPGRLFDLVFTAAPSVDQWSADDRRTVFAGSHRGFAKIPGVSAHRRTVALDDDRPEVSIEDVVEGNATGIVVHTRFHLDANVRADLRGNVVVLKRTGTIGEVQIDFGSSDSLTVGLESDWIARGYGRREAATVVVATKNTTLPYRQNITIKAS